jgi:hypothetical protein
MILKASKSLRKNFFQCNVCGKFIAYIDIGEGKARHRMITPDSDLSVEEWETVCIKCLKKEQNEKRPSDDKRVSEG